MFIRKIQSNIKKGVDLELGEKTLIVGPNGAGKSSVINSIELALTQSVSDLRGKQLVKKGGDLITLAPPGKDLTVIAELSSGKATTVTIPRTDTGAGRARVKNKLKGKLPFNDVRSILTSKPAALKEWIVEHAGNSVSRPLVLEMIEGEELKERYVRLAGSSKADELEIIKQVQTKNQDNIKSYREEIRSSEKAIEKMSISEPCPSAQVIQDMQKNASKVYDQLRAFTDKKQVIRSTEHDIKKKKDRLSRLCAQISEHEKDLDVALTASNLSRPVTEQDEFIVALRNKLIDMAKIHMAMGVSDCMLCVGGKNIDFEGRITSLSGMNSTIEDALKAHNARISLEKETLRLRKEAQGVATEIKNLQKECATESHEYIDTQIRELKEQWTNITSHIEKLKQIQLRYSELNELKNSIPKFQAKVETAKKLDSALKDVLEKIATGSTDTFVADVQSFLPSSYRFAVSVGDRVSVGFSEGQIIKEALSGAEWASMIMAMSAACADSTLFNVITPEERAFDPKTLYNVMDVLTTCPYQVVVTSTVAPSSSVDGWTVIYLE